MNEIMINIVRKARIPTTVAPTTAFFVLLPVVFINRLYVQAVALIPQIKAIRKLLITYNCSSKNATSETTFLKNN
jgi:hypothetical protein